MKTPKTDNAEVNITAIALTTVAFNLVGTSPLVPHAVSFKARSELLFPSPRKNQAERATSMKHEPFEEFRAAAYKYESDDRPTRLYMPGGSFHAAMADAAIDMVGAKKAQIGRLTTIAEEKVNVWGVPQIWSTIVRSSDMARTPDVRTLPILPRWCARITVRFVGSLIKTASVANLLGAAGVIIGVGDGRPQKGKKAFGTFRVADENDKEFLAIQKHGGRAAQDAGLAEPAFYDLETQELLSWFSEERGRRHAAPAKEYQSSKRRNGGAEKHLPA